MRSTLEKPCRIDEDGGALRPGQLDVTDPHIAPSPFT